MLNPIKLASKNFLSSLDISCEEFLYILELAKKFKNKGWAYLRRAFTVSF